MADRKKAKKKAVKQQPSKSRMKAKTSAKAASKPAGKTKTAAKKKLAPKIDPLNRKQYTSITPMLTVKDVRGAAEFYSRAFGFSVRGIMNGPGGAAMHAELRLRDTTLMLSPEAPQMQNLSARSIGGTPVSLYILVENVDAVFGTAVSAGGKVLMPVMDMFWGDRCCMIADPEGNRWMVATHKAEPTAAQMQQAMSQMEQAGQGGTAAAAAAREK